MVRKIGKTDNQSLPCRQFVFFFADFGTKNYNTLTD